MTDQDKNIIPDDVQDEAAQAAEELVSKPADGQAPEVAEAAVSDELADESLPPDEPIDAQAEQPAHDEDAVDEADAVDSPAQEPDSLAEPNENQDEVDIEDEQPDSEEAPAEQDAEESDPEEASAEQASEEAGPEEAPAEQTSEEPDPEEAPAEQDAEEADAEEAPAEQASQEPDAEEAPAEQDAEEPDAEEAPAEQSTEDADAETDSDEDAEDAGHAEGADQMSDAGDKLTVEEATDAEAAKRVSQQLPDTADLRAELAKERQRSTFFRVLRSTLFSLVVVAAAAVIVVTLVLPILQISGSSMTDTLYDQDIVVAVRGSDCQTGDVIAFYYNNKILVKRVIANSGQWVDIDDAGNVYVDGVLLNEPYVTEKALGDCNIKLPYQVPENRIFVMGDHRSVSVDSRSTTVGCVADEQIVGKLVFCAWPVERFGLVR